MCMLVCKYKFTPTFFKETYLNKYSLPRAKKDWQVEREDEYVKIHKPYRS